MRPRPRLTIVLLLVVAAAASAWGIRVRPRRSSTDLTAAARVALASGKCVEAMRLAQEAVGSEPSSTAALLVAGDASRKAGRYAEALAFYDRIPDHAGPDAVEALSQAGELLRFLGRAGNAEDRFRRAVDRDPQHTFARHRLAVLLAIEGRGWEALPHYFELLKQGNADVDLLMHVGHPDTFFGPRAELERFQQADLSDPGPLIGLARVAIKEDRTSDAERLLREVIGVAPGLVEAHVRLGQLLVERDEPGAYHEWLAHLPSAAAADPAIWAIQGQWSEQRRDLRAAVRCFAEAACYNPHERVAYYRLAVLLEAQGESALAAACKERAERLLALEQTINLLTINRHNADMMQVAARQCESLGRLWEAAGWLRCIRAIRPDVPGVQEQLARLESLLEDDSPSGLSSANPVLALDLSAWPLPAQPASAYRPPLTPSDGAPAQQDLSQVRFKDRAAEAGIDFTYFNSPDLETEGARVQETNGGGVAVLDYEGDGWPDLWFTQGCAWPADPGQRMYLDRLFRNRGDGRFQDVTEAAGLADSGFGQGAAVADVDGDGFPDVCVANIGANRLWHNNGDGTFSDVTARAGISGNPWTVHFVVADLNGDAWPDIYEVNYAEGDDIYERICSPDGHVFRTCPPNAWQPQQDRLWVNQGDGHFVDQSIQAGIQAPGGYGLGIIAADFDGSGRLSLFVANDTTPNFYFVNGTPAPGALPVFTEQAMVSGLALDHDGRAHSCMGVAIGDVDGNGMLDLYVTNFYGEASTLYLQETPGRLFIDDTARAGLREPSLPFVKWGTQFIDGELDGWPDLIITNGHVDDYRSFGEPYRMRPQFFRNLGKGRFVELPAASLGPFFQGEYLGRGLARLDWNRDGLEDVAISHIGSPAALLTNVTQDHGHFLAIQLHAVTTARDAIGTTVHVTAGGRTRMGQLTAGDGYQASNQRQLVFGLGPSERVEELAVHWPSGLEQSFRDLPVDMELLLIEGRPEPARLPAPDR